MKSIKMIVWIPAVVVGLTAVWISRNVPTFIELRPSAASSGETMAAVTYSEHGDASVLQYTTSSPRPLLQPHQVLIRVHASSINPCDFKFRRNKVPGFIPPKPKIPGEDVAGRVVQVGDAVTNVQVGDRVAAMLPMLGSRWGSAADYVAVNAKLVAKMGDNTSYIDAAALPLVSLTAMQALERVTKPTQGQNILIQAGAGGVGSFAIQYAKHVLGMYVAATASAEKADRLRELGCDRVVDYRSEWFEEVIQEYDVVLDPMSWLYESRTLRKGSKVLKPGGHYLNIQSSDWAFEDSVERSNGLNTYVNWIYHKIRNLIQPGSIPKYSLVVVHPDGEQLQTVMDLLDNSTLRALVDRMFPLSEARAAFEYLEQGHATGKVILVNDVEHKETE